MLKMPREDQEGADMSFVLEQVIRHYFMGKQITIVEGDVSELLMKPAEEKQNETISDDELAKAIGVR